MKLPTFDHARKKWDNYHHFHVDHHGRYGYPLFTQFETGELRVNHARLKPAARIYYEKFDVSLTSTNDGVHSFLTPDGEKVPTAWLTQGGSQTLLVDHDLGRAYRLVSRYVNDRQALPSYLRGSCLAYLEEGKEPITFGGIQIAHPDKEFTKANKAWLSDVRAAATAIVRLKGLSNPWIVKAFAVKDEHLKLDVQEFVSKWADHELYRIATAGFQTRRAVTEVPYLELV